MRGFRRFCVGITVLLVAWSAQTARAQYEPGRYQGNSSGALAWPPPQLSGQMPYPPAGYSAGGLPPQIVPAQYQQGPPMAGPPGMAPVFGPGNNMQPYPGLDLFRYGVQRTTNENGIWYKEMLNTRRDFKASVEYLVPIYNQPGDTLFGYGGISTGIEETDGIPPFRFTTPRDATVATTNNNNNNNNNVNPPDSAASYFPVRNFDRMFNGMSGGGVLVEFGFTDEDGSGMSVNGWYGGEANDVFQRGGIPRHAYIPAEDPFTILGNDPLFLDDLNALNGALSINNGVGVADRIPFDTMFEMQFSQQAWGAGVQIYRPPVITSSWYQLRPILGVRYVDLQEQFNFRGLDSGADYTILTAADVNQSGGNGNNNNNNNTNTGNPVNGTPDETTFNDGTNDGTLSNGFPVPTFPTNPYEVQVGASNQVRAAGPEIGFRADLGSGKNTRVWFMATAGVTATKETLNLRGFGVYNHFVNSVDPDGDILTPDGGALGTGVGAIPDATTAFNDQSSTTHVSPTLDLSANVEFHLFEYIPLLNKIELLEDAKFKSSYGFLYVGNISRPQESVNYTTFPINPSLNPNRSGWTMQKWTFGLNWEY